MEQFFTKLVFHCALFLALTVLIIYGIYINETGITAPNFSELPGNFISNSLCFNAKLEHAKHEKKLAKINCILLGSSISLNNVDAGLLGRKNGFTVYNLSSWGLKPYQSFQFLKSLHNKIKPDYLIITFNNTDFGQDDKEIKYNTIYEYLFDSTILNRISSFLAHFNIQDFMSDWAKRSKFAKRDNVYESLQFDAYGSILLNARNFQYSPHIQPLAYRDTTGYAVFQTGIDSIAHYCKERHIGLFLVYSPWKKEVLTPEKTTHIRAISERMRRRYKGSLLDLSGFYISDNYYVDGGHLYKKGAEIMTAEISRIMEQ